MTSVLEELERRANEIHYVFVQSGRLQNRREMKTRSNGRIQKCGGKALNYTHVLYENRRKLAWLRLHNRQFNAHDVKRVCKKVSNEIINVSVWCVGINIMPPGSASSDVLLKSCSKFFFFVFININDRQYYFLLFVIFQFSSKQLNRCVFISGASPKTHFQTFFHSQMEQPRPGCSNLRFQNPSRILFSVLAMSEHISSFQRNRNPSFAHPA